MREQAPFRALCKYEPGYKDLHKLLTYQVMTGKFTLTILNLDTLTLINLNMEICLRMEALHHIFVDARRGCRIWSVIKLETIYQFCLEST